MMKSIPLTGLFVLALFYTAYMSRAILLPIVLALFLTILLRPVVRFLKKFKIPEIVGAAFVLCFFLAIVGYGIALLSEPAGEWIKKAPESFQQISPKLKSLIEPARRAQKTVEDLHRMTGDDKPKNQITVEPGPSITVSVLTGTQNFIAKSAVMLMLLFFFLASGDLFFRKLMHLLPGYRERNQTAKIVQVVEHAVSRYLLTITIINAAEGLVIGIAMYLIGMPNPMLWGVMAALLIYVPYLGPLIGISIVAVAAALTFQDIGRILLAPGVYLVIESLQGQIVTPYVLGARFALNPVAIFLWLLFWGWFWGIIGALIAVPMLTVFKICCDLIEPLKPISEFLSD